MRNIITTGYYFIVSTVDECYKEREYIFLEW